jgi:putative N6-adenine-specific DNA methylase
LVFNIHISHKECTLSLDSSGESLHKRGYRVAQTDAPLSEVLAAGMILKSGWRGESAFVDPMCGSGTLLIEAAMIALGIPPGIHREHFAFEKWMDFDEELFSEVYNDDSSSRDFMYRIIGSDISAKAIDIAEKNIKNAGLKIYIDLSIKPFQQYAEAPTESGVLMTNPPYGERLKVEELDALYSMIGERLKHVFTGYNAYILSYKKESFDNIGLKYSKRFFLYNGALECEMREYEIFAGKRNMQPRDENPEEKKPRDERHYERNSKEGYRRSKRNEERDDDVETWRAASPNDDRNDRPKREFRETPFADKQKRDFDNGDKPFKRGERSFDRNDNKPRGERSFDRERKPFERDRKPSFDREKKPFDRDRKPSFDRDRKPFDRDKRPRERSFDRDKKPFEKSFDKPRGERSFDRDDKPRGGRSFDRDRKPFDRDNKSRDFKKKDFGTRDSRKSDDGRREGSYRKPSGGGVLMRKRRDK